MDINMISQHSGLWRGCITISDTTTCESLPSSCSNLPSMALDSCHKLLGARAFMTITCILAPFSVICILLNLMRNTSSNQMITMISKILPSVCFVFGIIGVALGISFITNDNNEDFVQLGAAGALGILAVIFNFSAAVVATFIQ